MYRQESDYLLPFVQHLFTLCRYVCMNIKKNTLHYMESFNCLILSFSII